MLAEILAYNKSALSRIASLAFSLVFVYDHLQNAEKYRGTRTDQMQSIPENGKGYN